MEDIKAPGLAQEIETLAPVLDEPIVKELKGKSKVEIREELIGRLLAQQKKYADEKTDQESLWRDVKDAYRGLPNTDGDHPYQASWVIREVFRQVESMKPQLNESLFSQDRFFKYKPKITEQDEQSHVAGEIVHQQIFGRDLDVEIKKWVALCPFYGVSYIRFGWEQFQRFKYKLTKAHYMEDESQWERESVEIEGEGPYLEFVSPWRVYADPRIENIQDSPYVFIKDKVSSEFLKSEVRRGQFDRDAVKKVLTEGGAVNRKAPENYMEDDQEDISVDPDMEYDILYCWTNAGMEYVVVGDKHLVRAIENPFVEIPIYSIQNYPQDGEHFGVSEVELLLADHYILHDATSMWVDSNHYDLNPMFRVSPMAMQKFKYTEFTPGGVIEADPGEVEMLQTKRQSFELQNTIEYIKSQMKLTTGMTDEVTGAGSRHRTATGVVRLQDAAALRLQYKIELWTPALRRLYKKLYELNAQFLDDDSAERIAGMDDVDVTVKKSPEIFAPDIDVEIEMPRHMESDMERQQKMLALYQTISGDPLVDRKLLLEEILKAYRFPRPKKFLVDPSTVLKDAQDEDAILLSVGQIPNPKPEENHVVHNQQHQTFPFRPEVQELQFTDPEYYEQVIRENQMHMKIHQMYQGQMEAQSASAAQMGPGGPQDDTQTEGDLRAQQMFGMADTGAQAQGVPQAG